MSEEDAQQEIRRLGVLVTRARALLRTGQYETCPTCKGTGNDPVNEFVICETCEQLGYVSPD